MRRLAVTGLHLPAPAPSRLPQGRFPAILPYPACRRAPRKRGGQASPTFLQRKIVYADIPRH